MTELETLLSEHRSAVEKFVQYRMKPSDADDILQEIWLAAFRQFDRLSDRAKFKPWILGIARRKCADWLRSQYGRREIPLDALEGRLCSHGCMREFRTSIVLDTLDSLGEDERNILKLCYFGELPQKEIAERLGIPLGTVKSRLHYAREKFRDAYPQKPKGRNIMTKLPEILPEYTITPTLEAPFEAICEELDGWLLDAGQPTTHFNILRERGLDSRLVRIDEAAPLYHISEDFKPVRTDGKLPYILNLAASNDMPCRLEQLKLLDATLRHFGYPKDRLRFEYMNGFSHCEYNNKPIFGSIIADFVSNC